MAEIDNVRLSAHIVALEMITEGLLLRLLPNPFERQEFMEELAQAIKENPNRFKSKLSPTEHGRLLDEILGALEEIPRFGSIT